MATAIGSVYGTAAALTMTWASLASSTTDVGIQSDVLDISAMSPRPDDVWIGGKVTLGTTPTINTRVEVYVFPSYDGTSFAGGAFGATAAAVSPPSTSFPPGFKVLGALCANMGVLAATTGLVLKWGVSLKLRLGSLPPKIVLYGTHNTVAALNATGTNHEVRYISRYYEY